MSDSQNTGTVARVMLRVPVPWVFVLTYLLGAGLQSIFHLGGFLNNGSLATPVGSVVLSLGVALAAWGWLIFHRAETTKVPGEKSTTLVTWGPYRFTRNPMYVGLSAVYLGEAGLLHQTAPAILLPLTIVYLNQVVIPLEEERLLAVFGARYQQYRNTVRRWL